MKSPKTASTRFQLPLGVSGLEPDSAEPGTLSFDAAADKIRVKLSTGWTDVGSGGGGGSVSSIASADTSVIVTNPTGPAVDLSVTKTSIGLGNVTNDAQLKRSANDFSSFSHKSTPVGADVLLIEDSAASGVKKYSTVTEVLAAIPSVYANPFDPAQQPGISTAESLEFNTSTIPSSLRMFRVDTGAVLTPTSGVAPWKALTGGAQSSVTSVRWESHTFAASCLSVQLRNGVVGSAGNSVTQQLVYTLPNTLELGGGTGGWYVEVRFLNLQDLTTNASTSASALYYGFALRRDNGSGDPDFSDSTTHVGYWSDYQNSNAGMVMYATGNLRLDQTASLTNKAATPSSIPVERMGMFCKPSAVSPLSSSGNQMGCTWGGHKLNKFYSATGNSNRSFKHLLVFAYNNAIDNNGAPNTGPVLDDLIHIDYIRIFRQTTTDGTTPKFF